MKTVKIGVLFLFVSFLILGCDDKKDIATLNYIDGVVNLHVESSSSGVSIKWENPVGHEYDKVELSYQLGTELVKETINIDEKYSYANIILPDNQVYKFTLRPLSVNEQKIAKEQHVKGRKLVKDDATDEILELLNSIEMYGGDGGVRLLWLNSKGIKATIKIKFNDANIDIDASKLIKEFTIPNLDLNTVYTFIVQVIIDDVASESRSFVLKPALGFRRIINDGWTITASSELADINAFATNLLDNSNLTYWQSESLPTGVPYLHYVIVDLKKIRKIQGISLSRKFGDGEYTSWDNNISLSLDGVNYYASYNYYGTNPDPNKIFAVEFNRTVEGEQLYLLPEVHDARFIRIDMVRASKRFALFGNLFIYGE